MRTCVEGMTRTELQIVKRAIDVLRLLTDEPQAVSAPPRNCPVSDFARRYLVLDPAGDVSCDELWTFYREISDAGELPAIRKVAFYRRLAAVMESAFGVKKCHSIQRDGRTVRGFKSVGIREDSCPVTTLELEPEAV